MTINNSARSVFVHVSTIFLVVLIAVAAVFVGYRIVNTDSSLTTFSGTLYKDRCSNPECNSYKLITIGRTYNLVLKTKPNIATGSRVNVVGSQKTTSGGVDGIIVSTITPQSSISKTVALANSKSDTPTNTYQLILTNANNHQTVNLVQGEKLIVSLVAVKWINHLLPDEVYSSQNAWSLHNNNLFVMQTAKINQSESPGYLVGEKIETTTGYFIAKNVGIAIIDGKSTGRSLCGPNTLCPQLASNLNYSVIIDVKAK